MPYDPDPQPTDPISVTRAEFDEACHRLTAAGAKLKDDRDQAWRDFAGWRVCYERVLLQFASLTTAPPAPWSADRPITFPPPTGHPAPRPTRTVRPQTCIRWVAADPGGQG